MSEIKKNSKTPACDLGALLEAGDAALVTLVAGEMQLAVHRSVLVAKSPVFAAMLTHDTVEASSGRIVIADVEPEVLQELVEFMYKDSIPQLCSMASQLLVAADKYCMPVLKALCEQQMVLDLSVENVLTSASFALRHSCTRLKEACGIFMQANFTRVMGTDGWAEKVSRHPEEFLEVSHLVAAKPAKPSVSGSASVTETNKNTKTPACNLGALLKSRDATLVTLVVGQLELVVHRSVLVAKSPVFATMLAHNTMEDSSGRIVIADIEPEVLQQLVLFMYKDSAPQLCSMVPQLLVAADKYRMPDLKAKCELQLIRDLSVENVMTSALIALRHSCPSLMESCNVFIRTNFIKVVCTDGWAQAVHKYPAEFMEVSHLIATPSSKTRNACQEEMDRKLLKAAADDTYVKVVELLAEGADVAARDMRGRTVLHLAALSNKHRVTTLGELLRAGADVGARDENGRTALHYAAARGHLRASESLLLDGARVDVRDRWLQTPLHASIKGNDLRVVQLLLAASSDMNTVDMYGDTPLHLVAQWGNEDMVKALLDVGVRKDIKNDERETPADVAERCKREHLLALLK